MKQAVEFESKNHKLFLRYSPRDDSSWVYNKFSEGKDLTIKGTFQFHQRHLVFDEDHQSSNDENNFVDSDTLKFEVATLNGEYFHFNQDVLQINYPLMIHHQAPIIWKWFIAEERTSIFRLIAEIRPQRIVIGGNESDAIPITEFQRLISNFPTHHELKRYVLARIGAVVREYTETGKDVENLYSNYLGKRLNKKARNITGLFHNAEKHKYRYLHERLSDMLTHENTYNESAWQGEILQIIRLLYPKYIKAIERVSVPDSINDGVTREIDILLIDASGNVDAIEIKRPFEKCIVTEGRYRDNHIPLRELSGSVMQIEKYLYYLNRWGHAGEIKLTAKYRDTLPNGFSIKITNPAGIIIMGRDNNLSDKQRRDFEIVKRKYRSIADIVTYDELMRRLEFIINQFQGS